MLSADYESNPTAYSTEILLKCKICRVNSYLCSNNSSIMFLTHNLYTKIFLLKNLYLLVRHTWITWPNYQLWPSFWRRWRKVRMDKGADRPATRFDAVSGSIVQNSVYLDKRSGTEVDGSSPPPPPPAVPPSSLAPFIRSHSKSSGILEGRIEQ